MSQLMIFRVSEVLRGLDRALARLFNIPSHPALSWNVVSEPTVSNEESQSGNAKATLESIFDGIFLAAVPKQRRSRERVATRRFGQHKVREFMTPRKNIRECLTCGTWHESHSICGECYKKVKEETEAMRAKMNPDVRLYDVPQSEVHYVYKGEEGDRKMHNGKYVVEMEKPRPEWFSKNLLTRGHGKY